MPYQTLMWREPVMGHNTCTLRGLARRQSVLSPVHALTYSLLQGWDKTYCLQFVEADGFTDIHFFGDKTFEVCVRPAVPSSAGGAALAACMRGAEGSAAIV